MDDTTIALTAEKILNKTFTPNVKGYDPDEVDDFLDLIMSDYAAFERYYREAKSYTVDLENRLRKAKESGAEMELELAKFRQRFAGIGPNDRVTDENIVLLQRIRVLENELFRLGVDPTKLK